MFNLQDLIQNRENFLIFKYNKYKSLEIWHLHLLFFGLPSDFTGATGKLVDEIQASCFVVGNADLSCPVNRNILIRTIPLQNKG